MERCRQSNDSCEGREICRDGGEKVGIWVELKAICVCMGAEEAPTIFFPISARQARCSHRLRGFSPRVSKNRALARHVGRDGVDGLYKKKEMSMTNLLEKTYISS